MGSKSESGLGGRGAKGRSGRDRQGAERSVPPQRSWRLGLARTMEGGWAPRVGMKWCWLSRSLAQDPCLPGYRLTQVPEAGLLAADRGGKVGSSI